MIVTVAITEYHSPSLFSSFCSTVSDLEPFVCWIRGNDGDNGNMGS